ncbi:MAG: YggS family pyridoxal phosphate-dependent enzyme [Bdellovibrionota bacterium]|nr:YggS family pyridoxal phosphate-dependent enzyme [Bdellovibrionota bacterium]
MNQRQGDLKKNLESLKAKVQSLSLDNISIVAVSKYSQFDDVNSLYELGHRDFGENRIDDLEHKADLAKAHGLNDIRWHFIGRIQSNKIRRIVNISNLHLIHSVSKLKHLEILNKESEKLDISTNVLLQVNLSDEPQKDGFLNLDRNTVNSAKGFKSLNVKGLMTMAENRSHCGDEVVKGTFDKCYQMYSQFFDHGIVSMGMSGDFEIAIGSGSNMIRVGSILFK